MNYWTTKNGDKIMVKDMEINHVEAVLGMLIKKYTLFCMSRGAMYLPGIDLNLMFEEDMRDMLDKTCANRTYLKRLVANDCFQEDIYSRLFPEE